MRIVRAHFIKHHGTFLERFPNLRPALDAAFARKQLRSKRMHIVPFRKGRSTAALTILPAMYERVVTV